MKRLIIIAGLMLAGCADPTAGPPPAPIVIKSNTFCQIAKTLPVSWSVHDTSDTIQNMRTIAHVRSCSCARVKPKACSSKQPPTT